MAKKRRDWLVMGSNRSVKCNICAEVRGNTGVNVREREHIENAFVEGTVISDKTAKVLLKKIDKHRDSKQHATACKIIQDQKHAALEQALVASCTLFEEQNKSLIELTERLFRTAYECASSHVSFRKYSRIVDLQSLNGLDCGSMLYSHNSCAVMVDHIATEMRTEIVQHIISSESKFSIMIDESTDVSNVQNLIVYIRCAVDMNVHVYFVGLVPLELATAAAVFDKLVSFLHDIGFTEGVLSRQLIGFCSDGASSMIGQFHGVATLLRNRYNQVESLYGS